MDEKRYILDAFQKHFARYRSAPMVIYGLGINTKNVLEAFPEYNIIGLMDEARIGERVFGKPVICMDEAVGLGVEAVIIIARAANVPIIYHRIARACGEYGIPVFSINGELLTLQKKGAFSTAHITKRKRSALYEKIDRCQIVSFDLFDTVLMRRVLLPTDIFLSVEQKLRDSGWAYPFFKERRRAELELLSEGRQPQLKDIYERMASHWTAFKIPQEGWMGLEIGTEKGELLVREGMQEVLEHARDMGRQVFFTSDMYLTAEVLSQLLKSVGIHAEAGEVIVSCQYGMSKTGGLHRVLRGRFPDQRILHIGDDAQADGACAEAEGIDEVFIVDSAYRMLGVSAAGGLLQFCGELKDRMVLGSLAAGQFSDPFIFERTGGKVIIRSGYDLGYYFLAPVLTVFVRWLLQRAEQYGLTKLLLASRDGYLIKRLLDAVHAADPDRRLPEYIYFYTSRAACVRAAIWDEADILYAAERIPFSGTAGELLQKRFGVEREELLERDADGSDRDYILRHKDVILEHSQEARRQYNVYLSSLKIRDGDRCGFFDLVSGGTCQYALSRFWDVELQGLYLLRFYDPAKAGLPIDALYQETNIYERDSALIERYFLLEKVMTSFEPTLIGFDDRGTPLFGKETRSREELGTLKEIQKGILDAFSRYGPTDVELADGLIGLLDREHAVCDLPFLRATSMVDEFCNRDFAIPIF